MPTVQIKENKMGVMPVNKLLINMSLPMMFSMLVQAFYNIADSIFVSRFSQDALTAVSLAFPFQMLMFSFILGTCVGVNALLSMRLGQKNQDAVNATAANGIFLAFCNYIGFCILAFVLVDPYLKSQTSNPLIIEYAKTYLSIVMYAGFGVCFGITFDRLLQSTGKTFYTMITQIIGAGTNIIFDPLLIFGIGPFPRMGIAGAAIATVAGQILSMTVSIIFNFKVNHEIHITFKRFKPDGLIIGQIYKVGFPSIILQAVGSFTTYGMNLIFKAFGSLSDTIIAVYGAYFKLNSFVFMPVFGLNNGVVPIVAYNYGARNRKRITATIRSSLLFAVGIMSLGVTVFELFPDILLGFFKASLSMRAIGIPALRIIGTSFIGAAIAISLGSVFQALGSAVYSMTVSIARQVGVLLPVAFAFSLTGNIDLVWLCFPIAEVVSVALSLCFFARIYRKKLACL
ncbi:MATE family efflux transporter [Treponema sp.]|uniref:MATE family efflux transporter n=1 Tax=Treponema sp. TaxID=166 RepID=UPI00298DDF0A|nr:MATE family efflux transporter [Treponema sp.]